MTLFWCFCLWFFSGLALIPLRCLIGNRCQPLQDGGIRTAGNVILIALAVGEMICKAIRGD